MAVSRGAPSWTTRPPSESWGLRPRPPTCPPETPAFAGVTAGKGIYRPEAATQAATSAATLFAAAFNGAPTLLASIFPPIGALAVKRCLAIAVPPGPARIASQAIGHASGRGRGWPNG